MKPQRRNDVEGFGLARHCAGFSMSAKREYLGAILGQNERENTGKWGGINLKTCCEKAVKSQVWRAFRAVSAYTMMLLLLNKGDVPGCLSNGAHYGTDPPKVLARTVIGAHCTGGQLARKPPLAGSAGKGRREGRPGIRKAGTGPALGRSDNLSGRRRRRHRARSGSGRIAGRTSGVPRWRSGTCR